MTRQVTFLVAAVSLGAGALTYAAAVWLSNDLSASGLAIVPAAVMAAALVWYFEWRSDLRWRLLSDRRRPDGDSETAARES
jgi:hypothetical protein